jgi:ferrous iron transport protein A
MNQDGIPLTRLIPGQSATVVRVAGKGPARRRYMEMGFVRGERVVVERVAPLGDPIEYLVKGYHLSLRQRDAERIFVDGVSGDGNA